MKYLAHTAENREQTLEEHLNKTAELAGRFAERFGKKEWGYCCGLLHDIGKYSLEFQKKITEDNNIRVDHATAGAQLCHELPGLYSIMCYCIAGHHTGLPNYGSGADTGSVPTLCGRLEKNIKDYSAYKAEIEIPKLNSFPFDQNKTEDPSFSLSVFIRMLYSCLVDADFLDTEFFMKDGRIERDSGECVEVLFEKLQKHIEGWLKNQEQDTVNGRRTEILKNCIACGREEKGLFRLTVPTGGGKTIASLGFGLSHAVKHKMDRVIYVVPYTSIIEQNAEVFRKILGEGNVLENHCNVDYESSDELKPLQLASENWDKPIVVTTNVQFFESLYGNKSSKCRKLHNIANSVIIFDEAQMLPNDYMKPCIAMIEELVRNYQASIVLCTATQPALTCFFQKNTDIRELCPRMEEQFRFFERVTYQNMGIVTEEELVGKLNKEKQVLCVVNTRKKAQSIYHHLEGEGVYHLSTSMYPKHRQRILNKVRERLSKDERCVLVSTSLVEAGVDLDFQMVYRQLAGVDSMIQAAGRCNREGKRNQKESIVSIFQFEEAERVPGQRQQIDVSKMLLADKEDLSSLGTIQRYFEILYHFKGESLDRKRILDEFQKQRYNFAKVGKEFKLIEENTKTLCITQEHEAEQLLEQMANQGYTKSGMRKISRYCIQVRENEFKKLNGAGMVRPVSEDMEEFYKLTDEEQYTEDMGLNLNIESGMALFG